MNPSPKVLIGASIPRSGHHFLQNLLTKFFGPQLHYCEFYSPKDCCKTVPCTKRGEFGFIYQKSHDREMEVPKTIADAVYVVQYRHPVPEALSDRELDVVDGIGRISLNYRLGREHYAQWLAVKAVYYHRFHDKWIAERVPNGIYLDYSELSAAPVDAVERIVRAAAGSADRARIEAVVEDSKSVRVSTSTKGPATFKPRVVEDSPHFDADLLGAFEDYVISRAPRFGYERMLKGSWQGHPLYGLILAIDESEPLPAGQEDRLEAAVAIAGEHPELMIRLAQRDTRAGKLEAAIERLHRVVEQHPYCTHAYKPLLTAYRQLKATPPATLFSGNALLGMAGRPETLVDAGKALLDGGQVVNAVAALTLAVTFAPGNARAHHFLANAMLKAGKPKQALPHAETATEIDPSNQAAGHLLATVRKRLATAPRAA
ncbi:MAG TPA: tetratricopeptide repeat protein [Crenalkalicoccus sp.]|jgi:tetratricopeptide (TPR) repeat protein|nr:tetratricopeptide repeat protein [Crenalkalicoccus sp.]